MLGERQAWSQPGSSQASADLLQATHLGLLGREWMSERDRTEKAARRQKEGYQGPGKREAAIISSNSDEITRQPT